MLTNVPPLCRAGAQGRAAHRAPHTPAAAARASAAPGAVTQQTHPVMPSQLPDRYAIVQLGGVRQVLEEGHDYSCRKALLQRAAGGAAAVDGSELALDGAVLGVRSGGIFHAGAPFLSRAHVCVTLLHEYQGPAPLHMDGHAAAHPSHPDDGAADGNSSASGSEQLVDLPTQITPSRGDGDDAATMLEGIPPLVDTLMVQYRCTVIKCYDEDGMKERSGGGTGAA
jgi:hypothetical protein